MQKLSFVSALVMGLGLGLGCGGGGAVGEMEGWRDKMCKCDSEECVEKTFADYRAWTKKMRADMKDMSKEDRKRFKEEEGPKLEKIESELKECRRKHRKGDAGGGSEGGGE